MDGHRIAGQPPNWISFINQTANNMPWHHAA
jgi:hypothetical protein